MKKYTCKDWLHGVDNVAAEKKNFNLEEWVKVEVKRQEINEKVIQSKYTELLEKYEEGLIQSTDEEKFKNVWYLELHSAIEETMIHGKSLSPELEALEDAFAELNHFKGLSIAMPYPKYPEDIKAQNAAKAFAYTKLYQHLQNQLTEENKEIASSQNGLTTKQQILLIHYLNKIGAISLNKIHQDETVQALVFSKLLMRDESNIRKYLNQISDTKYKKIYFTKNNLTTILPIIERIGNNEIVVEINREIDSVELGKENI